MKVNIPFSQYRKQQKTKNQIVLFLLNQDGGVEGRAFTPSCENTRITTSCWTIINRKTLELTK